MWKKLLLFLVFFVALTSSAWAWSINDTPVSYGEFVTTNNYGQVVVDSDGNVYVATGSVGIRKYDSSGSLLTTFSGSNAAFGVTIDPDGNILVADTNSTIGSIPGVKKYDSAGNAIDISGTDLGGTAYFAFAYGIDTDSSGNVYVSDITSNEVYKFNSSGAYVATIVGNGGSFDSPQMVAVDNSDNLYVLDSNNDRIQKFTADGTFSLEVTNLTTGNYPESFTVDGDGNMYVSDSDKIRIFNAAGTWVQDIDETAFSLADGAAYFVGLGFSNDGILYVGDYNNKIFKANFDRTPATVSTPNLPGNETTDTTPIFTGTVTDSLSIVTGVEFSVDGGGYTACTADDGAFDETSEAYTCTVSTPLSAGSHTITIRSTDDYDHTNSGDTLASYTFSVTSTTTENVASSGFTPPDKPAACNDFKPNVAPDLFRIDMNGSQATLYYSPLNDSDNYVIWYSEDPNIDQHSVMTYQGKSTGVLYYTINDLKPNTTYYFKVRGQNGCMPGDWSEQLTITTKSKNISLFSIFEKYNPKKVLATVRQVVKETVNPMVLETEVTQ